MPKIDLTKYDLTRLGAQINEENNAAHDLWTWLPSHKVAEKHHGDYASEHCPSNADVMKEATMYMTYLKHPEDALTAEERDWFASCPCGEDHAKESA